MMDSGQLTERVAIEQPTESRTSTGAVSTTWGTLESRWAKITPRSGAERYTGVRIAAEYDDVIQIRGYLAVTEKMRVTHTDGRKWDIVAIEAEDGKAPANAAWLTLACKRGQRQGS